MRIFLEFLMLSSILFFGSLVGGFMVVLIMACNFIKWLLNNEIED